MARWRQDDNDDHGWDCRECKRKGKSRLEARGSKLGAQGHAPFIPKGSRIKEYKGRNGAVR